MSVHTGQQAVVSVAVATLWQKPDAVRPVDTPILGAAVDPGRWVRGLGHDDQVHDGILTQLLLGERVLVEEQRDGWVRVVALEQPAAKLDPRGYPGWLPAAQLTAEPAQSTVDDAAYTVDSMRTALCLEPGGTIVIADVGAGTRLMADGHERDGWLPVRVPGHGSPLWAVAMDLVPAAASTVDRADVLAFARRWLGTTYIWGGLTGYGIDCSGLVHLAWRRFGVTLPRDADDQFHAAEPVPPGEELPGDLYFFARPGREAHHIGIAAAPPTGTGEGERTMVHACYNQRRVVHEPVRGDRHETLIATRRIPHPS